MTLSRCLGALGACLLGLASAYRFDRSEASAALAEDKRTDERCQYSTTPKALQSGRPPHASLVAVCPNNVTIKAKCLSGAKSSAHSVVESSDVSIGIADCEEYCNQNLFMGAYKKKMCLGYVVRNPCNKGLGEGKAQCWLIHGDAKPSESFPDEVKIERSTLTGDGSKMTHIKEFCGAEARIIHFQRPEFRTQLVLKRHELGNMLKALEKAADERGGSTDGLPSMGTLGASTDESFDYDALKKLKEEVKALELQALKYKRMERFEGVYDWLPIRIPHRVVKGAEVILPQKWLKKFLPDVIHNQQGNYRRYWQAPVRISKIYKKSDLSAFLYLCMDKTSKKEAWYLATSHDPITWAGKTFRDLAEQSDDEVKAALKDTSFLKKAFFRMACVGTEIEENNMIEYKAQNDWVREFVELQFFRGDEEGKRLRPFGGFRNFKQAEEALEQLVVKEVGSCPVEGLTSSADSSRISLLNLWSGDMMEKMGAAQWIVDKLSKPDRVSRAGVQVVKWVSKGYAWLRGQPKEAKGLHDYSNAEVKLMMARMATLLKGASKLFLVMEAAENTDDEQIKAVCAKEVLDQIFNISGLMPKVSQNLAMRPDLVKDDFVRNKLKETQNANPSRSKEDTIAYLQKQNASICFESMQECHPLLDILEYKKALSAGSVGQVDLFSLRKESDKAEAFRKLMPPGRGDLVIVKTVFEETEEAYGNDWNLLELFFNNCGKRCEGKLRMMWEKVLKPMEKSIFDEFNLKDEADFTLRGQKMLAEFTKQIDEGVYKSTLPPGSIKLTTPNAVATTSKYILIQSLAGGTPLKNYLEDSVGQIERIVEWRKTIYSSILMVYGHMVLNYGFFQSDPHNGNWFWEPETKTVTLIDWGGVGQLDQSTHCKLANLYSHMGKLTEAWSQCESVVLTGAVEIAGTYHRSGFSIYQASEEETALLYGKTYGVSYFNEPMGLRLLYTDAGKWEIVREDPGKEVLNTVIASLETNVTKMEKLTKMGPQKWLFSWKKGKTKAKEVQAEMTDPRECKLPSRKEAYSRAALNMGLGMDIACPVKDMVVVPEAPFTEDEDALEKWTDNGKRQLSCLVESKDETYLSWGLYTKIQLLVEEKDDMRWVTMPDGKRYDLDAAYDEEMAEGFVIEAFEKDTQRKLESMSPSKRNMLLNAAQSQQALAAALYDSDILMAAVLGLGAKNSVGLVNPDVPDEYVLLARCILVFHGMLGDVLKENFVRLVVTDQQDYIQWLVRSGGDRFFRSWLKPAEDFKSQGQCVEEAGGWKALEVPP